jgi:RNA polymerase sigma-70 factor, ECF subfamily
MRQSEVSDWNIACECGFRIGGQEMPTACLDFEADDCVGIPSGLEASQAFGHILTKALPVLHRRAYRLLGNAADAEDAVQDALVAAYTHLNQFRGYSRMSTWITAILNNCARMQLRTRRRHFFVPLDDSPGERTEHAVSERLPDHRLSPEDECRNSELSERLAHFHSHLSPTQRRAFQLRDIDGLSIRETAQILGVPRGTVKAQSARARRKLKELMRRALRPQSPNQTSRVRRIA